jgi:ribosomal protein S18 acetylase RimI-like enzyme
MGKAAQEVIKKRMKNTSNIIYTETDARDLDLIGPLWRKLIKHHKERALKVFSRHYDRINFDVRKKQLLEKSGNGAILIDLARDGNTGALIGYCVSTVSEKKQGEIESIYIEAGYRRNSIGDNLMKRALKWLDARSVTKKIIGVAAGNEGVFAFYRRYNFYPRVSILEQVDTKEADSSLRSE